MRRTIIFATFVLGFTAMSAQIVLLRQLIVAFYGNEISAGLLLGAWLFWGAVGSCLLGRLADRTRNQRSVFANLQLVLSFLLPGAVFIMRNARNILGSFAGEVIGLLPMALFSFLVLLFICTILGFLFALACRAYPQQEPTIQIGRVYLLEALGAVCGGVLVSFFLVRYFDALYLMLGLAGLNLISAYFLQRGLSRPRYVGVSRGINLILIFILLALLFSQKAEELKQLSLRQQWRGFRLLTSQDSIYGNLALTKADTQYSFFSNGLQLFTVPDTASSEEAVHFGLLETPNPRRVLLIGGGIGGLSAEILKHPVESLHYVELDPEIVALGRQFLPPEHLGFLKDPRLKVFHEDGRLFVRQAQARADFSPYDSIIMYLGQPYTAQLNRFYTRQFFQKVKRCLTTQGVFSFSLPSSENFLNPEQQQFLASIHKTLKSVFNDVKTIPGDTVCFLAADKKGLLSYDYTMLLGRLQERGVQTQFVREYYLSAKMSSGRIAYLEEKISAEKKAQVNSDFRPISYYYDMVLWSAYFAGPWRRIFSALNEKGIWTLFLLAYLAVLAFGFWPRAAKAAKSRLVLLAVSTTGLAELAFQVVILLAFQIIYGYLYYKLGIILSSFMAGLVLGSWLFAKIAPRLLDDYGAFIKTQVAICAYPIILPLVFYALNEFEAPLHGIGGNIVFPLLPIISGFVGGFQFPLANKIILRNKQAIGRTAGLAYGMDLLGSCAGALLVSTFLVPILGITQSCFAIALLNTAVLVALLVNRKG